MTKNLTCETKCSHNELVTNVQQKMAETHSLQVLSELFKVLGDHTRIRILSALTHEELCVCDLSDILEMSQSAISHQLRVLRAARIVKFRKEGKNVRYSLDDDHIYELLSTGMAHITEL